MSFGKSNTETRILQMQLENKDFEEGVRQTIKSLENLEEKLNLKNAGDGFEKVSAAANSVQTSHLESGIDSITSKFTLMGQIGLQALERISSKVVDTGTKILRAATVQPMIDGWGEFEMKTNSIQTILGGIRNQFDDQPTAINAISDALDDLNEYADKTIYNFAQMTENVGKFTNQGLGLEQSTNAIKGIANWAAAVGANPQQMSRAMYNISQSLGAGSMQLIDWRSIRFANMATPEVKKLFAEVAKKMNPRMFDKNGKITVGKKKLDVLEDFESSLKAGWLTNDVMAEAFSIYANAYSQEELVAKYGEELGNQFYEMGVYAEEAATKVRTFSQLIGVLKESLGSGWANTFDILFGGFEQQTEFLTAIKERIEEIINFQTDDRNNWLQNFSDVGGVKAFQDVILQTLDILKDFYWVFNDVFAVIFDPFGHSEADMSESVFGPRQEGYTHLATTWENAKGIFDDISSTLTRFRTWMKASDGKTGRSPIQNLANALSGVAGAAGIAVKVLGGFGKLAFRIIKRFRPLVDSVLDMLGQIGATIYNLFFNLTGQETIEGIFDRIGDAIEPVIDFVVGLSSAIVDLIHNLLGIDSAANDWNVIGDWLTTFMDIFDYNPDITFAENLRWSIYDALVLAFGPETAENMLKAWDTNIAPILARISGAFEQAFGEVSRIFNGLSSAFGADYSNTKNGPLTFLRSFFEGYYGDDKAGSDAAYANVLGIYMQIEEYYNKNIAPHVKALSEIFTVTLPDLNKKISDFLFGSEQTIYTFTDSGVLQKSYVYKSGLIDNLMNMFSTDNIDGVLNQVRSFFDPIIQGFRDALHKLYAFFAGEDVEVLDRGRWRQGHNTGLFEIIQNYFNSETWKENWEIIQGAFTEISSWITTNGSAAWNTIMDFLFGPEKTANLNGPGQAQKFRSGGAYQAALDFLTPVWDWLRSTGSKLYDYIINHNFQEMWKGLNDLLFGYDTVYNTTGPGQAATVHTDGILTPVVEMLRPIADVFNQVKGWALEKLSGIDWSGIWESVGKFFTGYDEIIYDSVNPTMAVGVTHHEGIFEKIVGFFEKVIAFFERPEIQKILNWIGGLGERIWGAITGLFSGQGLAGIGDVGAYLSNGIGKLLGQLFPSGEVANGQSKSGGFDLMGLISSMLFGTASADEATAETKDEAGAIIATLDQTKKQTSNVGQVISSIPDNLMKLAGPIIAIFGASAANKLLSTITGREKTTFMDKLVALFDAIGGLFQGMGILIGAVAIGEKISPDSVSKAFNSVKDILWNITAIMGVIGGASWGLDLLGEFGESKIASHFADMKPNSITSVSDNILKFGEAFKDFVEGLKILLGVVETLAFIDQIMDVDAGVKRAGTLISTLFTSLFGPETGVMLAVSEAMNGANTLLAGWLTTQNAPGMSTKNRVTAATDTMSSTMAGIGSLFYSVADGISSIITATAILVPLIPDGKFENVIKLITTVGDVMKSVVGALDILAGIKTVGKISDTISIFGVNSKNAQGIIDKKPSSGSNAFLTAIKGIGIATIAVAALELLGGMALWIIEKNIDNYAKTVYRAMALVKNVIEMINSITPDSTSSAQQIIDSSGGIITSVAAWSWSGDPIKNANTFRKMGVDLSIGLESLNLATNGYKSGRLMEVFKDLEGAWKYLHFTDGDGKFDVADFQGKISFLERAGQGFASMAQSFRGVTQTDIDNLGIIKTYAGELNTISSLLAGVSAFNVFTGFNGKSFVETLLEMSRIGHVIKDENGEVQGLEELDGEKIKGYFNEILLALPDDPQLLHKLDAFTAAGGSNIGLFASGLMGLNTALTDYKEIMTQLNTDTFTADTNVLGTIDKLGQQLDNDYSFLGQSTVQNMNTRLGIFATDLRSLAEAFGVLAYSSRDANGVDYNLEPVKDLLTSVNMLGTYIDKGGWTVSLNDNLETYASHFAVIATSVEGLITTIQSFGFNTSDLKPVGDFLVQIAGIEQILTGYQEALPTGNTEIHDLNEHNDFVAKSALWMNEFIPLLSTLGQGIHDMWAPLKEDKFDFTMLSGAGDFLSDLATFMSADLYTSIQIMTPEQIGSYTTAFTELKNSVTGVDNATSLATTIQQIFDQIGDKEVKLKITPVFDDTSFSTNMNLPENLNMPLNNAYSRNITLQVNMNEVQNVRIDASQISALINANNATRQQVAYLSEDIQDVAKAVRAMQVVLDTGVIAGAVDDYMGYSTFIAGRTG